MNRVLKKVSVAIILLMVAVSVMAIGEYPTRVVNGKQYIVYTVQKGEGFYGISKRFNVTQVEILDCNPEIGQGGLKVGQEILIPTNKQLPASSTQNQYKIHRVEAKQTLYSLSRMYNVAIAEIIEANPEVANGLKVGTDLRIPMKKTEVAPKPVSSSVSTTDPITVPKKEGAAVLPDSTEGAFDDGTPGPNTYLRIPSTEEMVAKGLQEPMVTHLDGAFRVAVMMPFMSQQGVIERSAERFYEFYRGVLVALDKLKKEGLSVEVEVYDIEKAPNVLDSVLRLETLKQVDLIIGPAYTNQVSRVSEFSKEHGIYTVVPFTSKIDPAYQHPHLIQFNPSQDVLLRLVAKRIVEKFNYYQFVVTRFPNADDKANGLASELIAELKVKRIPYKEVYYDELTEAEFVTAIDKRNVFLFVAATNVQTVTPILDKIMETNPAGLVVWGFEEWNSALEIFPNTFYYSLFYNRQNDEYLNTYSHWFGDRLLQNESPAYDLIGYDIMYYFGRQSRVDGTKLKAPHDIHPVGMLQSDMLFKQANKYSAFVNLRYYIYLYNGYAKTKVE